jgi:hypothetical protein
VLRFINYSCSKCIFIKPVLINSRERRRRGRRAVSSEDCDALPLPSQQHQKTQNSGSKQSSLSMDGADTIAVRRSSINARSPAKIPREQLEQQQQEHQQQEQQQLQQQQQMESGELDRTSSDTVPYEQDKKRKLVGS